MGLIFINLLFCGLLLHRTNKLKDQLNGHRFSPHPYTIYSMRSTFIEDQLMKGTPVIEVAEMAGHDVRETQRTYARLNLRRKGTGANTSRNG